MKASRAAERARFAGDTSRAGSVAFEGKGDTCDTYDPSAAGPGSRVSREPEAPEEEGSSSAAREGARGAPRRGTVGAPALLDSSLRDTAADPDAVDRCLRWIVLACIAPALDAARPAGLRLASLSLTSPDEDAIDEAVEDFAHAMVDHSLGGALLARDLGREHGRAHYHGLALAHSLDAIRDHWAEFVGPRANEPKVEPVDPWRGFCREPYERRFGEHVLRVVQYAFKPWPVGYGRRSLDRDVVASGAFVGPLRAVRAAVARGYPFTLDSPVEPSPTCRLCLWCGRPLPAGARSDKLRHDRCRKRASKAKRREVQEAEGRKPSERPPDDTP